MSAWDSITWYSAICDECGESFTVKIDNDVLEIVYCPGCGNKCAISNKWNEKR